MVCLLVCFCVFDTGEPAQMAELIVNWFEVLTVAGLRNHVLIGVQIPNGKGNFWGRMMLEFSHMSSVPNGY